jgi:hypothetical protein
MPKKRSQRPFRFQPLDINRLNLRRSVAWFALGEGQVQQCAQYVKDAQRNRYPDSAFVRLHAAQNGSGSALR